jgi:hypothetical protein
MINGFKDLEGSVAGSNLPVCQYTLQRARQFTDSISFALAVHPFVSNSSKLLARPYLCGALGSCTQWLAELCRHGSCCCCFAAAAVTLPKPVWHCSALGTLILQAIDKD